MACLKTGGSGRLVAAHFNHRLRGEEAAADEAFVIQLSRQLHIPCEVGRAEPGSWKAAGKQGLEAVARRARYLFLRTVADRVGARYVVTAHTADDQAETVLHRILRGAGLRGLAGIPRARPLSDAAVLIRPMLELRRSELLEFLNSLGQSFREDSTNRRLQHTRNRIRRQLLPVLAAHYNRDVAAALSRLAYLAAESQSVMDQWTAGLADRSVRRGAVGVEIDCEMLAGIHRHLVRELLMAVWKRQKWPQRAMTFRHWQEMAALALGPPWPDGAAKKVFPGGVQVEKREGRLILHRPETQPELVRTSLDPPGRTATPRNS